METQDRPIPAPRSSGRVEANGVNYYYEIHGSGEPLLMLHGGLGSIEMLGPVLTMLASEREVIAVDLHGHGRTQLGDREISLIDIGDDMAVLLKRLGYEQVDALGYSFGGGVAFRIVSDELDAIRADLADAFRGHLTQQDSHGWRPHITVQNKVTAAVARALHDRLAAGFEPRPLELAGLAYDHYAGGPWLPGRRYPFRGR